MTRRPSATYENQALLTIRNSLVSSHAKVPMLLLHNDLWELAFEFYTVNNAEIQACLKLIGNHAGKSCLEKGNDGKSSSCVNDSFKVPFCETFPTKNR